MRSARLWAPRRRISSAAISGSLVATTAAPARSPARRPAPKQHAPRAAAEVLDAQPGRRDRDVVVALPREHPQLCRQVGLEGAVAVEVVGREVEQHRRLGRERDGVLELEDEHLADDVAPGSSAPTSEASGVPTLPATATATPASRWIAPSSSIVVVLPFVPVTAMNSLGSRRQASSSSPITVEPALARRARSPARPAGTPGYLTGTRRAARRAVRAGRPAVALLRSGARSTPIASPRARSSSARRPGAREPDDEIGAGRERRPASA